jgi:Glycosyl hydrolases family 39
VHRFGAGVRSRWRAILIVATALAIVGVSVARLRDERSSPTKGAGSATQPSVLSGPGGACAFAARAWGIHQDLGYEPDKRARQTGVSQAGGVLHAQISRNSFLWDVIEPAPGSFDWSRFDEIADDLRAAHVEVLFVLVGSPSWANGTNDRFVVPTSDATFSAWVSSYATFARAAADRYRGRVRWEVWNEPNNSTFWNPEPHAAHYAELFTAVRNAIRAADPNAPVAIGGLDNLTRAGPNDVAGEDFLASLAALGAPLDTIAVHPYPTDGHPPGIDVPGENNVDDVDKVIAIAPRAEIWVTEIGWDHSKIGLDAQATDVRDVLEILDRRPAVTVTIVFIDRDRPQYQWGLLDTSGSPLAAGNAFASFVASHPASCAGG